MTLRSLFGIALLLSLLSGSARADLPDKRSGKSLPKIQDGAIYRPFLINAVFNYYGNNGDGSYNRFSTDNEGFEFLKGTNKHLIFEDGIIWGGFHKGYATVDAKGNSIPRAKVGGSIYRHGLQPGPIIQSGTPTADPVGADPTDQKYRIYRVRPDVGPRVPFSQIQGTIQSGEVAYISRYENSSAQDIYDQYITDWNEWPASLGAPFSYGIDAAGNQRSAPAPYDPKYDIPGQPGADQTLWYVANDMNTALTGLLAGSPPIGLEIQRTIWGYHRKGPIDQVIFISTLIVNRSGAAIDSMFICQFSDPDIGDGGDDFDGCDTLRDLGYAYNGKPADAAYGSGVPAAGFTFLQGPLVPSPSDSAIFRLKRRSGYRNLHMSAFEGFFSPFDFDPLPYDDRYFYNVMNGAIGSSGSPMIDPVTQLPTRFFAPGDPVSRTGWIDGMAGLSPQDRRMYQSAGPFRMAAGDTQEIVVANCAGAGADYLSSITVLRSIVDRLSSAYRNLLALPAPPHAPAVIASALDGEVILTWGDSTTLAMTEGAADQGFLFEGYNVYEFASPSGAGPVLLGTFDLVNGTKAIADTVYDPSTGLFLTNVIQRGSDSGILHSMDIKKSLLSGLPLSDGSPYYFAVTAYSYSGNPPAIAGTHSLESSPGVLTVIPHSPNPGTRYNQTRGDSIPVTLTVAPGGGPTDGRVVPTVADPAKVTGDSYAVTFNVDSTTRTTTWGIKDLTKNRSLVSRLTNQSGGTSSPIVDGVQVEVFAPPSGMKSDDTLDAPQDPGKWGWRFAGTRRWSWVGANSSAYPLEGFSGGGVVSGTMGAAFSFWNTSLGAADMANVLFVLAATDSAGNPVSSGDPNMSYGYRFLRGAPFPPANPSFAPFIKNGAASFAFQDYVKTIPLAAYNMDVNPPQRLALAFLENNVTGGLVDGKYWPPLVGADNSAATSPREWLFVLKAPYTDATPNVAFETNLNTGAGAMPLMWQIIADRRSSAGWAAGDQFEIIANHVNGPAHTFTFTPKAPRVNDPAIARADVTRINVFPNPYQSFDRGDPTRFTQVVTFTHLPPRAIVRIYTLAGIMVKSILKDDPGQFLAWDMKNESGRPVAAGMYLVHIQMPDLGSTKTLKLGILAERQ